MKILGRNDYNQKGILIEYDAGYISPKDNQKIISEMRELDFSEDIISYAVLCLKILPGWDLGQMMLVRD